MPPDRRPPSRSRAPEELDGFLAGLRHALDRRRAEGRDDPVAEDGWERARRAIELGDRTAAARYLTEVDDRLRADREESELTEFPRGLVGYVPKGDRGAPVPPEEEPLEQRRRLVLRLADLVELSPPDRARVESDLARAERALARGDRREAKRTIDEAHALVESSTER